MVGFFKKSSNAEKELIKIGYTKVSKFKWSKKSKIGDGIIFHAEICEMGDGTFTIKFT